MGHFSEGDKLKYYQNGRTKQASQQATDHPEAVGGAGSAGAAGVIEAVEVLELLGGHVEDEDTTHPIEILLYSLDIMQIINKNGLKLFFCKNLQKFFKKCKSYSEGCLNKLSRKFSL